MKIRLIIHPRAACTYLLPVLDYVEGVVEVQKHA